MEQPLGFIPGGVQFSFSIENVFVWVKTVSKNLVWNFGKVMMSLICIKVKLTIMFYVVKLQLNYCYSLYIFDDIVIKSDAIEKNLS